MIAFQDQSMMGHTCGSEEARMEDAEDDVVDPGGGR